MTTEEALQLTFNTYLNQIYAYEGNERLGQHAFNLLWTHRPDLSERVRGGSLDPFYNDAVLNNFLSFVEREW